MSHELQSSAASPTVLEAGAARWASRWFELDRLPVMLIGFDGRVVHANPAGQRLIDDGGVAEFQSGMLVFHDAFAQRAFRAALQAVVGGEPETASTIVRCNDSVLRRMDVMHCGAANPAFVVLHGIGQSPTDLSTLAAALGFTPAERRILALLADGAAPKAIAAALNISPNTVRVHLRSVYGKMRVHGMSNLVRECTRLTA